MNLKCIIGLHTWNGCKCKACGKTRDEEHEFAQDCEKCTKCESTRPNAHKWNDTQVCEICGKQKSAVMLGKLQEKLRDKHRYMFSFDGRGSSIEEKQNNLIDLSFLLKILALGVADDSNTAASHKDSPTIVFETEQDRMLRRFEKEAVESKQNNAKLCIYAADEYIRNDPLSSGEPFMIRGDAYLYLAKLTLDSPSIDRAWVDYEKAISIAPTESYTPHCIQALQFISEFRKAMKLS